MNDKDIQIINGIKIETYAKNYIRLIDVKTGDIEQEIQTNHNVAIEYMEHRIVMRIYASNTYPNKTGISTNVQLALHKEFDIDEIIALFLEYNNQMELNKDFYNHIDMNNLSRQHNERYQVRDLILKEEEKYKRKLLQAEIKRIAKENVDELRPPVTAITSSKDVKYIEE